MLEMIQKGGEEAKGGQNLPLSLGATPYTLSEQKETPLGVEGGPSPEG